MALLCFWLIEYQQLLEPTTTACTYHAHQIYIL